MKSSKIIVFLTSTNIAVNPRLAKELILALKNGFGIYLITFRLNNWSDKQSENFLSTLQESERIHLVYLNASKQPIIQWLFWGVLEKLARFLYFLIKENVHLNALASSRRSFQIYYQVNKLKIKPDLIFGHNLAALYPAWRLSRKWRVPFVFDVEDYHPGEYIRFDAKNEKRRREFLMKKLLPQAAAITSASPLIGEYTMNLIGGHQNRFVVLNSFPQAEFTEPTNQQASITIKQEDKLKLVWFSQKISYGRGLEQMFEAMKLLQKESNTFVNSLTLTIIGALDSAFDADVISSFRAQSFLDCINILPPMKQDELHQSLCRFDVGLALEFDQTDLNRQLCLTNKIIAYAQSGLFILATDTPAQKEFISSHPDCGVICGQSPVQMQDGLLSILQQQKMIELNRRGRFEKAKAFAWENEGKKLTRLINKII